MDYCERALEIQIEQIGPNHVDVVANSNVILGTLCQDAGDLGKAKDYYERELEIRKEQLDPDR